MVLQFPFPSAPAFPLVTPHRLRAWYRTRSRKLSDNLFPVFYCTSDLTNSLPFRKIERGMAAYEKNTGKLHPFFNGNRTSRKRSTGSVSLIDYYSHYWYGTISIGTPPVDYTGMTLSSGRRYRLSCVVYSAV